MMSKSRKEAAIDLIKARDIVRELGGAATEDHLKLVKEAERDYNNATNASKK